MRVYVACFIAGAVLALAGAYIFTSGELHTLRERAEQYRTASIQAEGRASSLAAELADAERDIEDLALALTDSRAAHKRVVGELAASIVALGDLDSAIGESAERSRGAEDINRELADIFRGIRERSGADSP